MNIIEEHLVTPSTSHLTPSLPIHLIPDDISDVQMTPASVKDIEIFPVAPSPHTPMFHTLESTPAVSTHTAPAFSLPIYATLIPDDSAIISSTKIDMPTTFDKDFTLSGKPLGNSVDILISNKRAHPTVGLDLAHNTDNDRIVLK